MSDHLSKAIELLDSLTDPDPCSFDHHGGCQTHGFLSLEPGDICPNREAVDLVKAYRLEQNG